MPDDGRQDVYAKGQHHGVVEEGQQRVLGDQAAASLPGIRQVVVARSAALSGEAFEERLFLARRAIERKQSITAELIALVGEVSDLEAQQAKMIASERANRGRLDRVRTQKEVVKATYSAAQAQLAAGESAAELSAQLADVGSATRRIQDQVDEISVRASALEELQRAGLLDMPGEMD